MNPLEYCDHGLEASEGLRSEGRDAYDARGIYLCKVCDKCEAYKLGKFRPEVLTSATYSHDEPIDEE
jgi:hypothetical protein